MAPTRAGVVDLIIDGRSHQVDASISVAAALSNAGIGAVRTSVSGKARAPLCGMGICYECRVTIDGVAHRRACLVPVANGMIVQTTGPVP